MSIRKLPTVAFDTAIYQYKTPNVLGLNYAAGTLSSASTTDPVAVTITGNDFYSGMTVVVDRTTVTAVTLSGSTSATFSSPIKASGTYNLFAINAGGAVGQYPPGISYTGAALSVTYSLSIVGGITSTNEGTSFIVALTTTNLSNGALVPYTISGTGITSADIGGASLSGNFIVSNNAATLSVTVTSDAATEGNEVLTVSLLGVTPTVSTSISLIDTSLGISYALSASTASVNEGGSFTITLTTTSVSNGTLVPYTITGVSSADIGGASLTGNFTVSNGSASLAVTVTADSLTEGTETFTLTLNNKIPTISASVTIVDTSITPTYSLSSSVASVNEGASFTVTLTTAGVNTGTVIPYTITGVSSADINNASLTGNFTVTGSYSSGSATATFNVTADVTTEGTETFTLTLNSITPTKTVSVTVNDTSTSLFTATGGTIATTGGYRIHTFTGNADFTVSYAPPNATVDILLIGGGGGGGGSGDRSGGGGGAGGFVEQTGVAITAGTYNIVVGLGGTAGFTPTSGPTGNVYSTNGGNSTGLGYTAYGGGKAAHTLPYSSTYIPGGTGGSGGGGWGGAAGNAANGAGSGTGTQGYAGGSGGAYPVSAGGGGGAGGAGMNGTTWNCWGSFIRSLAGNGGLGRQSSISGTLTTYAGGGGAGVQHISPSGGVYSIPGVGGYGPDAVKIWHGTASSSGNVLNVTAVTEGQIYVGMVIAMQTYTPRTVTGFGTGTGGIGTYYTDVSQNFSSTSNINGFYQQPPAIGNGGGGNGTYNGAGGAGTNGTGGGGGGGGQDQVGGNSHNSAGGNGGSGIVIIRYPYS